MRAEDIAEVRALPLFSSCADDTFTDLTSSAFLQRFPVGVELVREGDPADFLYVVTEGLVELFAHHNGRETTLSLVRPVGLFILAAVLRDNVYLQSARTLERSRVLMIPAASVRAEMHSDIGFAGAVVDHLADGYRDLVRQLKDQKLRSGAERLANWLLRTHDRQGATGHIEIPFEKRVLASRLGMTPENLSRAFKTLQNYSVAVEGAKIIISDAQDLAVLAKPDPLIDDLTT